MGRCYEFGVSIDSACEHAMSVVGDGGACECTVCGAHCPGRFSGCAEVVSQPGYVPALAPVWARLGRERAAPDRELAAAPPSARPVLNRPAPPGTSRPLGDVESELTAIRELVEKLLDRPAADDLGSLRAGLEERDAELTAMFERFLGAHVELAAQIQTTADARTDLSQRIDRLERRLAAVAELLEGRNGPLDWLRRLG